MHPEPMALALDRVARHASPCAVSTVQPRMHISGTLYTFDIIVLHSAALLAAAAFVLPTPDLMVSLFCPDRPV